jgi:hypothetical protein
MTQPSKDSTPATPGPPQSAKPIKLPNPPEDEGAKTSPEVPKVGSRDAPGG